jgi:cyanophycin synthetase
MMAKSVGGSRVLPDIPIISVTGTKGKTTVVNLIADILKRSGYNALHVDTTGHFINGARKSTIDDSKRIWRLKTPSLTPGRYLGEFLGHPKLQENPVAILECAFSCARRGLGYRCHNVGVFLNVFEDHIDPTGWITSKQDLADAKSFIFSSIADNGWAVFNADDELVCAALTKLPAQRTVKLIPCGLKFDHFDLPAHLAKGGAAFTVADGAIRMLRGKRQTVLCDLDTVPWTFHGAFLPSVWNVLFACAALYGFYDGELPKGMRASIEDTRLDATKGRLVVLRAENGPTILADYAHEKVSLAAVADLARTLLGEGGRVIGVVRLNHERPDALIRETGHVLADAYDALVVYDKIDGFWRKPAATTIKRYPQVAGRTAGILAEAIAERNENVECILREDKALQYAASIVKPNDVVVAIVNDDVQRSMRLIQEAFGATIR